MKFCKSIDEFVTKYQSYQKMYNTRPVLAEKNRCVVASHAPELRLCGEIFALSFHIIEPDAITKGLDTSKWN